MNSTIARHGFTTGTPMRIPSYRPRIRVSHVRAQVESLISAGASPRMPKFKVAIVKPSIVKLAIRRLRPGIAVKARAKGGTNRMRPLGIGPTWKVNVVYDAS
jgi:hypothetical protein